MNSVQTHYERHLGAVYTWMMGGFESATEQGAAELDAINAVPGNKDIAVDLGAGFGMHSIPLARRGFNVFAIDSCRTLLDELEAHKAQLPIQTAEDDLLSFAKHLSAPPRWVLCMNDTLTHLADEKAVLNLIQSVSEQLTQGGRFIATFRDYSIPLEAEERFIPVRSDPDRVFHAFSNIVKAISPSTIFSTSGMVTSGSQASVRIQNFDWTPSGLSRHWSNMVLRQSQNWAFRAW